MIYSINSTETMLCVPCSPKYTYSCCMLWQTHDCACTQTDAVHPYQDPLTSMVIAVTWCCVCVWHVQPLLPPPILLLLGVVLFGSGEAARFRNYQKHGGGEVCSSSFQSPLVPPIILTFVTLFCSFLVVQIRQHDLETTRSMVVEKHALLPSRCSDFYSRVSVWSLLSFCPWFCCFPLNPKIV